MHLDLLVVGLLHGLVDLCHLGDHLTSLLFVIRHVVCHLFTRLSNLFNVGICAISTVLLEDETSFK